MRGCSKSLTRSTALLLHSAMRASLTTTRASSFGSKQADDFEWLREAREDGGRYDLCSERAERESRACVVLLEEQSPRSLPTQLSQQLLLLYHCSCSSPLHFLSSCHYCSCCCCRTAAPSSSFEANCLIHSTNQRISARRKRTTTPKHTAAARSPTSHRPTLTFISPSPHLVLPAHSLIASRSPFVWPPACRRCPSFSVGHNG